MAAGLDELKASALAAIAAARDLDALKHVELRYLGKKGELTGLLRKLGELPPAERPAFGKAVNELKAEVEREVALCRASLDEEGFLQALAAMGFDATEPGLSPVAGNLHPITQVMHELVDVFAGLGFVWLDGPEIELEHYNFDALNIPPDHPARETQDTFWLEDGNVLRTHTSPVQVRAMLRFGAPLKAIVPGRCFRNEAVDASHEHTFYQMEGLMVDRDISVANLIHVMRTGLREILARDVKTRLRPGFFPFVEPGFELDVDCPFCQPSATERCHVCKGKRWIELMPCGMVHPNVLRHGRLDPEEWTGFAFGLGLQRLVMVRYGIHDIRDFTGGDLRFLAQFARS
jgi:phenylalanyl-tRNA synthetase alpha chain